MSQMFRDTHSSSYNSGVTKSSTDFEAMQPRLTLLLALVLFSTVLNSIPAMAKNGEKEYYKQLEKREKNYDKYERKNEKEWRKRNRNYGYGRYY